MQHSKHPASNGVTEAVRAAQAAEAAAESAQLREELAAARSGPTGLAGASSFSHSF